jgi:hypothetical protein
MWRLRKAQGPVFLAQSPAKKNTPCRHRLASCRPAESGRKPAAMLNSDARARAHTPKHFVSSCFQFHKNPGKSGRLIGVFGASLSSAAAAARRRRLALWLPLFFVTVVSFPPYPPGGGALWDQNLARVMLVESSEKSVFRCGAAPGKKFTSIFFRWSL